MIGCTMSQATGSRALPAESKSDRPNGVVAPSAGALAGTGFLLAVLLPGFAGNKSEDIPDKRSVQAFS